MSQEITINLHDGGDQITIVIVHKDKHEYLNILLQSISLMSTNNNYEIIVIDNASGKEGQDFLDQIEGDVKVIRNEQNLYWTAAANQGAAAADANSKFLMFLHCDVVVLDNKWLEYFIKASDQADLIGLETHEYTIQGRPVSVIQEWCMFITKKCWDAVGPFPETLPQIGSILITSLKSQKKQFKPHHLRNNLCHHYKSGVLSINELERLRESAQVEMPKLMKELMEENLNN